MHRPRHLRPFAALLPIAALVSISPLACAQALFGLPGSGAIPLQHTASVVVQGDFDGDGDPDFVLGGGYQATQLWLCEAGGRYRPASTGLPPSASLGVFGALAVDVDADGDPDVVAALASGFELWLNDGAANFSPAIGRLPASIPGSFTELVAGDFDADGDTDIVGQGGWNLLWLNDGAGRFTDASSQTPTTTSLIGDLRSGDVDADGDLDLLVGFAEMGTTCTGCGFAPRPLQPELWLNDGAAVFTRETARLPQQLAYVQSLSLADVDGDGDLDAALANYGQDLLWLNDGTGRFNDASAQLPATTEFTKALALVDLDGDGLVDLLRCTDEQSGARPVWLNNGSGRFDLRPRPAPAAAAQYGSILASDVDADGDLDVILAGRGAFAPGPTQLWLNDGAGAFVDATDPGLETPGAPGAVALGDIDGDGDVDAVSGDRVRLNRGDGSFESTTAPLPSVTPSAAPAIALADLDGDGALDVLVGRSGQSELWIWRGTSFVDATSSLPGDADPTTSIVLEDLDGDGDLDILLGNAGAQNRLWLNDGGLRFRDATSSLPPMQDDTRDLRAGDVDGDSDLDLVVANYSGLDRLLLNNGNATFSEASHRIPRSPHLSTCVELGDVDQDGDLDAIIGGGWTQWGPSSFFPEAVQLWRNDGSGSFVEDTGLLPSSPTARSLALVDVDEDGDLDAVLAGASNPTVSLDDQVVRLWRNDGSGGFSDASSLLAPIGPMPFGFAVGDIDEDGDLDILSAGRTQRNLVRHLATRMLPRVGQPLELEIHGPPNTRALLLAAAGPGRLSIPALGPLLLDPASAMVFGEIALDGLGSGSLGGQVPRDPGLVGQRIYWQALFGLAPGTSNLEITTLTSF